MDDSHGLAGLLYEFHRVSLKPLLAGHAAKVIGFTIKRDLELRCLLVQNRATNWILRHYPDLDLNERYTFHLLSLVVRKTAKTTHKKK